MRLGPGMLVTAAFIGPGTVTTCVLAGGRFGTSLLWTLVFATGATMALQEMAARLGATARVGLGEALMQSARRPLPRFLTAAAIIIAIGIGNAAYQGGNLAGGALGLATLAGDAAPARGIIILALATLAGAALAGGGYGFLERLLVLLVCAMSGAFILALILSPPDPAAVLAGLWPGLPDGSMLTALALVGTTIVPYNLFLHAAAARERFGAERDAKGARTDTVIAVGTGGLVSCAVLLTAAAAGGEVGDLASALDGPFGAFGRVLLGAGLLAAGLTSAITAPMAAGFVLSEILAGDASRRRRIFRGAALAVLATGTFISVAGTNPLTLIVIAQAANGLLLPAVAAYLLMVMNRRDVLGDRVNGRLPNAIGALVVVTTLGLGLRGIMRALEVWP